MEPMHMEPNSLEKIDNFARRHLLLSSFLCLLILGTIFNFFINYVETAKSSFDWAIEEIIDFALSTIIPIIFWIIPSFIISLLLCYFLKKKSSQEAGLSFSQKFLPAFIPALGIILIFSTLIFLTTPRPYSYNLTYICLAIFTSCLYSTVISAFLGWLSKASKAGIIVQSFIVSLLMGIFYLFLHFLSRLSFS